MASDSFAHLHVHTDFSKLDGMETVTEVAQFAARDGQPAAAITDHGNLSGYIKFEKACLDAGVRPIPGIEAYYVPSFEAVRAKQIKSRDHMLILGVTDEGYRNVLRMSSKAHLEQYYYKPLFDDSLIESHSEGLVLTSGCIGGPVGQAILRGDHDEAMKVMARHRDMVEPGHYFAEIQPHNFAEQTAVNKVLVPMAKKMGLPLLASQDAHYSAPGRALAHEKMLAMQTGSSLSDKSRFKFASHTNFLATAKEMRDMVPEDLYPGACDNTLLVAEMASGISKQAGSKYLIPSFPDAADQGGEREMLKRLVVEGARQRYGQHFGSAITERIDYELGVIHEMGFDAYFLIVWDFVKWAKYTAGIYVGPGRGSAAGSIVSYCLDITTLDPIKYGLFFERFLNPGRKSMPDIDIDFEPDGRARVRAYLADKYGYDHVAYISTQGLFHGRSAIKASARIHDIAPTVANSLSSTFPQNGKLTIREMAGDRDDLPKKSDPDKEFEQRREWDDGDSFRRAVRKGGSTIAEVVEDAANVEGYIQNFGKHAAAVLITPRPLTNFVPLTWEPRDGDDLATCGYDKDDAEAIGGLKMDLLGLINLTTVRRCVEQVKVNTGRDIDVNSLPMDDAKTFALLQRADTAGVFQLGGPGMKDLLRRVWPTRFEDLSAVLALYRPGPMGTEMHFSYADRKNGRESITVEHPDMMEFAAETHGLVVYQEQMLALAQKFAGFTAGEADTLRKATGKKDAELLAAQEGKFKSGMEKNGYPSRLADKLWAKLPSFAAYSFNKAHSAAYAMIAYQTAYLKANYPAEYAAACVDTLSDPALQMQWAKSAGVVFDVPDVNESDLGARAFNGVVRLGLSGIKGLGDSACGAIISERKAGGPFVSLSDFLVRTAASKKVNKNSVEALIEAGALDSLSSSRGEMKRCLPALMAEARAFVPRDAGEWGDGGGLLGDIEAPPAALSVDVNAEESLPLSERIGSQVARLGVFLGTHPLSLYQKHLLDTIPDISRVVSPQVPLGDVTVHGIVSGISEAKQTRKSQIRRITLEAIDGYSLDMKVFGDEASDIVSAGLGSLVVVDGTLQEDSWAKNVSPAAGAGADEEERISTEDESPRELIAHDWLVIPLAALNDADTTSDRHNVSVFVESEELLRDVAKALVGNMTPGMRLITIHTPQGSTPLPQMIAESAEQVGVLVAGLQGVRVEQA